MNVSDMPMTMLGLVIIIFLVVLSIMWFIFPLVVYYKLRASVETLATISQQLSSIDTGIAALRPAQPIEPPIPMAVCRCMTCSKEIQFDSTDFNPRNPPTIQCPHCGMDTQLYVSPAGILRA